MRSSATLHRFNGLSWNQYDNILTYTKDNKYKKEKEKKNTNKGCVSPSVFLLKPGVACTERTIVVDS